MAGIVQTMTLAPSGNVEEFMKALSGLKAFIESKGAGFNAYFALEAGAESGNTTIAISYPSAAAWAEMVDDESEEANAFRQRGAEHPGPVIATALLQEINVP